MEKHILGLRPLEPSLTTSPPGFLTVCHPPAQDSKEGFLTSCRCYKERKPKSNFERVEQSHHCKHMSPSPCSAFASRPRGSLANQPSQVPQCQQHGPAPRPRHRPHLYHAKAPNTLSATQVPIQWNVTARGYAMPR